MDIEETRAQFEDRMYLRHFLANVKFAPKKSFADVSGQLSKRELLVRDEKGDYQREDISAMWFGWCEGVKFAALKEVEAYAITSGSSKLIECGRPFPFSGRMLEIALKQQFENSSGNVVIATADQILDEIRAGNSIDGKLVVVQRRELETRLNNQIQDLVNANLSDPGKYVEHAGVRFAVGDPVMQTKNSLELDLHNGDVGKITHVDHENKSVEIDFHKNPLQQVVLTFDEMNSLRLYYASSFHRAQQIELVQSIIAGDRKFVALVKRTAEAMGVPYRSEMDQPKTLIPN